MARGTTPSGSSTGFYARDVAYEHRFVKEAEAIYGSMETADDALRAIEFATAREPQSMGICVDPDCSLYAIKVPQSRHTRGVVVYYTFDATKVTFQSIMASPD